MHVVIGNEACDLDSTAAALSYAYYLCKKVSSIKFINPSPHYENMPM